MTIGDLSARRLLAEDIDACAEVWKRATQIRQYQPGDERNPVLLHWMRELRLAPWPEIALPERPE